MMGDKEFKGPQPVGEPYRADPADPLPFPTENDAPPRHEPPPDLPEVPRWTRPPSHSPEFQPGAQPPPASGLQEGGSTGEQHVRPRGAPFNKDAAAQKVEPPTPAYRQARIGMWIGVASLFVFNIILGPVAIVMGISAIQRGEKRIGTRALGLGIAGTVTGIIVMVLVATGVMPSLDELMQDLREGR